MLCGARQVGKTTLQEQLILRVVVTGSSALRIEAGRDSLAGRITTLGIGMLLLREIAGLRFNRRVIRHDLRLGERGRKRAPALLEEVFRLACRYAGQAPIQAMLVSEIRQRILYCRAA